MLLDKVPKQYLHIEKYQLLQYLASQNKYEKIN